MKWFVDKLGVIVCVCAGLALTGLAALVCLSSIPAAIATGLTYIVIGLAVASYSTGLIYFAHRYGVSQERERNAEAEENAQIVNTDQQQVDALEAIANGATREYNVESSATVSRAEFLALQATITSQGRDILSLQQAQATRFQTQALGEIHHERDRVARGRTQVLDSDSSDPEQQPLMGGRSVGGRNAFFNERAPNTTAANEHFGVALRRKNNTSH